MYAGSDGYNKWHKGLLGKSKKVNSNDLLVEEQPQSSDFIRTILDETDIHFGVRIENQSLVVNQQQR